VTLLRGLKAEQAEAKRFAGEAWEDTGLVFVWIREKGKPSNGRPLRPDYVTRRFGELVTASGLPRVTFHGNRHSHGTALVASGINPKIAQERLGHHNPAYTMSVYAEVLPGMQEEAVAALEAATKASRD
jgi:integrase